MMVQNIDNIGELMEPNPIGFSLNAPGWTWLLWLLMALLTAFSLWKLHQYNKNKYRRLACKKLNTLIMDTNNLTDSTNKIISTIKRVAIRVYGKEQAGSINGLNFVHFLQTKTTNKAFSTNSETIFQRHLYEGKHAKISLEQVSTLHQESINWINEHRV